MAFDLLYLDGHDLRALELVSRRHLLEDLIGTANGAIQFSASIDADGNDLLSSICRQGLEGIVAKRADSSYRSGRGGEWLKIKCVQSDSFFIVGWEPSHAAFGGIGRLLLGAYRGSAITYVGGVGTGFNERTATALRKQLERLRTNKPAIRLKRTGAVFVEPTLIAEIEYRAWTEDGKLRHPSFKGLREIQDNAAVYKL